MDIWCCNLCSMSFTVIFLFRNLTWLRSRRGIPTSTHLRKQRSYRSFLKPTWQGAWPYPVDQSWTSFQFCSLAPYDNGSQEKSLEDPKSINLINQIRCKKPSSSPHSDHWLHQAQGRSKCHHCVLKISKSSIEFSRLNLSSPISTISDMIWYA